MDRRIASVVLASILALAAGRASAQDAVMIHARTQSEPDGVWLHYAIRGEGRPHWMGACAAPCALAFPYDAVLGLSLDGARPRRLDWQALPDAPLLLLRFDDHARARILGAVITVVGALASVVLGVWGGIHAMQTPGTDQSSSYAAFIAGAGVLTLGLSIGVPLMLDHDRLSIDVAP